MRAVFLMLKVEPNRLAEVADQVSELDTFSEAYSISGAYDLLVKLYVCLLYTSPSPRDRG